MSIARTWQAASGEPRLYRRMVVLAAAILLIDQASKAWAISALSDGREITLIPDLLRLRLLYNPGAAFSIGAGTTWVFTVATAVTVAAVLFVGRRLRSAAWTAALGGLLGGAGSHLLDRLSRDPGFGRGHVVDFIDYGVFVGNIADIALTVTCAVLFLLNLRGVPLGGTAGKERPEPEPPAAEDDAAPSARTERSEQS
ncbi:signal peptidase II [Actinomadura viridis]|uniref:signal peptidase II n=1 Tax=Actinomadura viridis TaxID=58110 RepID=UPI0036AC6791